MRILYIDCDSLRASHLGCYGYHRNTSPTIDELAENGRRFTNYYASDAPCLPSRTALFTARFGIHTGVINHSGVNAEPRSLGAARGSDRLGSFQTFTNSLRRGGYKTAFISPFPQRHGAWWVVDGFQEWIDTKGGGMDRADHVYPHAEEWLESNAEDEDWFLHLNFWDPHTPYDTPMEYGNPFEDDPIPDFPSEDIIEEQFQSYGPHSSPDLHHRYLNGDVEPPDLERTPEHISDRDDFQKWINGFDTGIRYMDDYIAKVLDLLEAKGVRDETLIIISADHGENQGELNVYGDHQTADYPTCRLPLIFNGPGVEPGVDDDFYYNVDFGPTLAEMFDLQTPSRWDGESFAPSVTEGESCGRDYLVLGMGAWSCQRSVRWDDWLLIRTYHDGFKDFDPVMLFDIEEDPHETTNLAKDHPSVVRQGLSRLDEWHSRRMQETALDKAGGNLQTPNALVDPIFEEIADGGPTYLRGKVESYCERLEATGREEHAETIREREGIVEQDVEAYITE